MSLKLIATDMDSTLLNNQLKISPKNEAQIYDAISKDIEVVFATGRCFLSASYYANQFPFNMPIIAYNGGLIKTSKSSEVLYCSKIPLEITQQIFEITEENGIFATAFIDDLLFCEKQNNIVESFSKAHRVPFREVGRLSNNLPGDANMINCIDSEENISKMKQAFQESPIMSQVNVTSSTPNSLEVMHKNVSKGNSLAYLCSFLGIEQHETLAIGNSLNDLSMLKWAGTGIALKNSDEQLLEKWNNVADYDNDHDGVYHVIKKYIQE